MKIVSEQLLTNTIGDSRITIFKLVSEEMYVMTLQEKGATQLVCVAQSNNGRLEFVPEDQSTESIQVSVVANISFADMEKLNFELSNLIKIEKERMESPNNKHN